MQENNKFIMRQIRMFGKDKKGSKTQAVKPEMDAKQVTRIDDENPYSIEDGYLKLSFVLIKDCK